MRFSQDPDQIIELNPFLSSPSRIPSRLRAFAYSPDSQTNRLPIHPNALTMPIMDRPVLSAPWRMDYIRSLHKDAPGGCFFCEAAAAITDAQRRDRLTLWTTEHMVVLINRYPYTNGHLLIAPKAHKADLDHLTPDEQLDLQVQTTAAVQLLRRAVSAQGFNIGINLGRCAGAGVPGHLHQHVVPRWAGDVNFMGVVGEVQVVPQAMSQLYDGLLRVRAAIELA
jgi:ATP adenylyltransferase